MKPVKSKYKFFGLASLIFVNTTSFIILWTVISEIYQRLLTPGYELEGIDIVFTIFAISLQSISLILLLTQCKYIKVKSDRIIFINPLLPFLRKTRYFNEFDYMQVVMEFSYVGDYGALWLIKDKKLKVRISSFYYSNIIELKNSINIEDRGVLYMNPLKQFGCLFGMKICVDEKISE